jgi:hypothetical protein
LFYSKHALLAIMFKTYSSIQIGVGPGRCQACVEGFELRTVAPVECISSASFASTITATYNLDAALLDDDAQTAALKLVRAMDWSC